MLRRWALVLVLVCGALLQIQVSALARNEAPTAAHEINLTALPLEARETLALVKKGGPYPYQRDGAVFGNYERRLPARNRGYYREYTVATPEAGNRGAKRIVVGAAHEYYYTDDHYRSFRRVRDEASRQLPAR